MGNDMFNYDIYDGCLGRIRPMIEISLTLEMIVSF